MTIFGKYLRHYSNGLEGLSGYGLKKDNCVFSLEGHFGNLPFKIFILIGPRLDFSHSYYILHHHSRTLSFLLPLSQKFGSLSLIQTSSKFHLSSWNHHANCCNRYLVEINFKNKLHKLSFLPPMSQSTLSLCCSKIIIPISWNLLVILLLD
jgi:hypothetical protein